MVSKTTSRLTRLRVGRHCRRGVALALAGLPAAAALVGCQAEGPTHPNLVLITVDRLAADRLHCFGGARGTGGSICGLGQRGTLYAWTASPGRGEASGAATVLTGLSETTHGVGHDGQSFLASAHDSIAEVLSRAGYATAAFVASPRVNRSRRLDQGFDLYDDRLASPSRRGPFREETTNGAKDSAVSIDLSSMVTAWIDRAPSPWFVWIHAERDAGLVELDRLVSRLSRTLDPAEDGPGVLFLALRGEPEPVAPENLGALDVDRTIGWRTHRVPLIWRPPTLDGPARASVSRRLASLMDIVPTLRAAAHLPPTPSKSDDDVSSYDSQLRGAGRDLGASERPQNDDASSEQRFLLLEVSGEVSGTGSEVGLASRNHLYTRQSSPLDGTGRPVQTSSLIPLAARFASLPDHDPLLDPATDSAQLEPGPWRKDVLDAESPVPRLEFHLAHQLGARRDALRSIQKRKDLE